MKNRQHSKALAVFTVSFTLRYMIFNNYLPKAKAFERLDIWLKKSKPKSTALSTYSTGASGF